MLNSHAILTPHIPTAHGGRLFDWGLSSKVPKPRWIVYVPDASPHESTRYPAYIQPENATHAGCLRSLNAYNLYIEKSIGIQVIFC